MLETAPTIFGSILMTQLNIRGHEHIAGLCTNIMNPPFPSYSGTPFSEVDQGYNDS